MDYPQHHSSITYDDINEPTDGYQIEESSATQSRRLALAHIFATFFAVPSDDNPLDLITNLFHDEDQYGNDGSNNTTHNEYDYDMSC